MSCVRSSAARCLRFPRAYACSAARGVGRRGARTTWITWLRCLVGVAALGGAPALAHAQCADDPLLSQAAAELLLARVQRPSPESLTQAVRAVGSDAVGLHALFVPPREPPSSEREWLAGLRTRVDGELACGRADSEAGRLLIAVGRGAELAAIDAQARVVRGQLRPGFHDAELVIADADAQLIRVGVSADDLQRGVTLAPELSAPIKVQLVARGPAGPRPVAERDLLAVTNAPGRSSSAAIPPATPDRTATTTRRTQPHDAISGAITGPSAPGAAADSGPARGPSSRGAAAASSGSGASSPAAAQSGAKELAALVLALRAERGRGSLRDNRLLRDAASQHAQDVCAKGRVAHEVEAGAGPDARLAQAGLSARVLGEAIARADDTHAALRALQNSPSHLYTLLDARFTDFGVGVARDSANKHCYVVLLCAWPRYIGKSQHER